MRSNIRKSSWWRLWHQTPVQVHPIVFEVIVKSLFQILMSIRMIVYNNKISLTTTKPVLPQQNLSFCLRHRNMQLIVMLHWDYIPVYPHKYYIIIMSSKYKTWYSLVLRRPHADWEKVYSFLISKWASVARLISYGTLRMRT